MIAPILVLRNLCCSHFEAFEKMPPRRPKGRPIPGRSLTGRDPALEYDLSSGEELDTPLNRQPDVDVQMREREVVEDSADDLALVDTVDSEFHTGRNNAAGQHTGTNRGEDGTSQAHLRPNQSTEAESGSRTLSARESGPTTYRPQLAAAANASNVPRTGDDTRRSWPQSERDPARITGESLLIELFQEWRNLKRAGAPQADIEEAKLEYDEACKAFGKATEPSREHHAPSEEHDKRRSVVALAKIRNPPELGSTSRSPTILQINRWIKDVDYCFDINLVQEDSIQRTKWITTLVKHTIYRDLLDRAIEAGTIKTWTELQAKIKSLSQDPVLTRYENYSKFWTTEWRSGEDFNSFYNLLTNREAALDIRPFEPGVDPDTLKISVVWAKLPDLIKREIQRAGQLKHVVNWADFERALRDAETATRTEDFPRPSRRGTGASTTSSSSGAKRSSSEQGGWRNKKQNRHLSRQNHDFPTSSKDSTPQPRSGNEAPRPREQSNFRKPGHWKQKSNNDGYKNDPSKNNRT